MIAQKIDFIFTEFSLICIIFFQQNEKHVQKSIEEEFEALQSQLRSRQEEMKRRLHNDIESIKRPILEQLRKHRSINSSIDDHQRKLSLIKGTQDPSLRIKVHLLNSLFFVKHLNWHIC